MRGMTDASFSFAAFAVNVFRAAVSLGARHWCILFYLGGCYNKKKKEAQDGDSGFGRWCV